MSVRKPSEKQLKYAQALAEKNGVELTEEINGNMTACSAFISKYENGKKDTRNNGMSVRKPSEKQLKYAQDLAKKNGVELTEEINGNMTACSAFISKYENGKKDTRNSDIGNVKSKSNDNKSQGWDIYQLIKAEMEGKKDKEITSSIAHRVKKHLNTYLESGFEGPDLLHSLMLKHVLDLTKDGHIKMLPFLRLWNPEQFRDEDFTRYKGKDGKIYPSLVEKVIQAVASDGVESNRSEDHDFILPHVESAMKHFPDNIWLKHSLSKLLEVMGRIDDARKLAIDVAREKTSESWVWERIGDLLPNDIDLRRSCYAKALLCSNNDDFVGKIRLKFAELLKKSQPAQARFEVDRMITYYTQAKFKISEKAKSLSGILAAIEPKPTDNAFYRRFSDAAEGLLFSHLPWSNACLGDVFTIPGRDGQNSRKRRRIYVKGDPFAIEMHLSNNHPDIRGLTKGAPLKIQYETSKAKPGHPKIHRVCNRKEGASMDIVPSRVGVIDNINEKKSVIHVIIDRDVGGTIPISLYSGKAKIGDVVAVRLVRYHSKSGEHIRIVEIESTDQEPSSDVCRPFRDNVTKVISNGSGFTRGDIFIPPQMITAEGIQEGDLVDGISVINFNRKHEKWGMKAVQIKTVEPSAELSETSEFNSF